LHILSWLAQSSAASLAFDLRSHSAEARSYKPLSAPHVRLLENTCRPFAFWRYFSSLWRFVLFEIRPPAFVRFITHWTLLLNTTIS
jgi:hypothetical protein